MELVTTSNTATKEQTNMMTKKRDTRDFSQKI